MVRMQTCPSGWLSIAAGYALPSGLEVDGAAALGRAGRWSLTNSFRKPLLAQLQLVCARLA